MKFKWEKKGLILAPKQDKFWNKMYAMLPVPYFIKEKNSIRIFFGTTDECFDGRISFIDVNADNPQEILYEHDDFIVDIGELGSFDDSGVVPSSIVEIDNKYYLYTVGFQRCEKVPYMLFAGLVVSENLLDFYRLSKAPILPREKDRFVGQGAPCVIYDENKYKMWHWYGTKWIEIKGKKFIDYHIGYAESEDGINWKMRKEPCISPVTSMKEFGVARPWVIREKDKYKMWYSVRYEDKMYRIGYAESVNGIDWIRKDNEVGIDVSKEGWDSEMICYPSVIKMRDKTYMFYNGNSNGKTGFGYAELIIKE